MLSFANRVDSWMLDRNLSNGCGVSWPMHERYALVRFG